MLKSRIAPTPSGYLHIGNACNFLLCWLWTRAENAQLLLRIDDLDRSRKRPEYIEDIFDTLDWLGIDWDEGPSGPDDFEANWSQHLRLDEYAKALEVLRYQELLFACDCTRSQVLAHSENGQYNGRCRERSLAFDADKVAWRIKTAAENIEWEDLWYGSMRIGLRQNMTDFVVRKKDRLPAYQIASIVDDRLFGITTVVRGQDLADSTAAQIWLSQYLTHLPQSQIQWAHHPLLTTAQGSKLSKSAGSLSMQAMRQNGAQQATVYQKCASLMGLEGDFFSIESLLEAYIHRPKITYDPRKAAE